MKIPKIKPRGTQVLVRPDGEGSRTSKNGIITPDNVEQEKKSIGTVIAVGPDLKDVKKNDRVIYGAYAGEKMKWKDGLNEIEVVLLFDEDVLAFIED